MQKTIYIVLKTLFSILTIAVFGTVALVLAILYQLVRLPFRLVNSMMMRSRQEAFTLRQWEQTQYSR